MKLLAISASPREGGNSDILCDRLLAGAVENGHKTEKIRIAEKNISPCLACGACQGEKHECMQKHDMPEVLQKLIDADGIVLAVPVYFYSMAAQMKILIDRCYSRYSEIANKQFYLIATAADPQDEAIEETVAGLRAFLRCLPGAQEKCVISGTGAWDKGDILRHPAYDEAYEIGTTI